MFNRKGQSTLEYAILIVIMCGVLLAMQFYVKRGFQGRWKSAVDGMGEQYDPRLVDSRIVHTVSSNSTTVVRAEPDRVDGTIEEGFITRRTDTTNSTDKRVGFIKVGQTDINTFTE